MSSKFSLPKVIFTAAIMAVIAFAAIVPGAVKAFSKQGGANFLARLIGRPEIAQEAPVVVTSAEVAAVAPLAEAFDDSPKMEDRSTTQTEGSSSESEETQYFELVGTLFANDGDQWDVNGISVVVSTTTELKGTLEIGMLVKVEGELQADGSVLAHEIKPALIGANPENNGNVDPGNPHNGDGESELIGTLTAIIDDNTWTLNGLITIVLDENTELESNIAVGDMIKVEGALQEDGSILAREIKHFAFEKMNGKAAFGESQIVGTLDEMSDETWKVSGFTVVLNEQTEREGTFEVGITVKVEGMFQSDGSILAREVKVLLATEESPEKIKEGQTELVGELTAINGNTWTVNGVSVTLSNITEVKGNLEVGMIVKVEGKLNDDGSITAREIKATHDGEGSGSDDNEDKKDDDHSSPGGGSEDGDKSSDDQGSSGGGDDHSGSGGSDDDHSGSGDGDHGGSGGGDDGGGDDHSGGGR